MRQILNLVPLAAALAVTACSSATTPPMQAHEPSLAVAPGASFVAWHGGIGERSSIYVQALDRSDRPAGASVAVSDGRRLAYEPDLVAAGDRLAIAWYEKDPLTGRLSAWLAMLSMREGIEWRMPLIGGRGDARNPVVRVVDGGLEVAWIEQAAADDGSNASAIWQQRFGLNGKAAAPPRRIGRANRDTWNLNAAVAGHDLLVVYDAALNTSAHELHMLIAGSEVRHRLLSTDDGHASLYPDLQINSAGQAALTWFDERDGNQEIYLAAAPFGQFVDGDPPAQKRITHSETASTGAYVAWNGATIGLAWTDETDGQRDVFGQAFTASGEPLGAARNLGPEREDAGVPAVRADGPGFLAAWNDYTIVGDASHMHIASSVLRFARFGVSR